ncbi:peptide-aspartate beta-dioxygenase [Aureococcus anophagefferens]|nr:peptide-aspartate beta-dioxygenase [Aureococcus anophagefferens]
MSQFDLEPLAPGARVLARHGDDAFFSEGAVEAVDGESYGVRFDFGAVGDDIPRRRIFTANQVQDAALPVGETVDALVDGEDDARVATATVVAVDGDAYHVVFEDPELGEASLTRPAALLLDDPPSPLKMSPRDDPAAEEPDEPEEPEEPDAEEDPEPAEAPPRPGDLVAVPAAPSRPDHDHDHENARRRRSRSKAGRPAVAAEAAAARRRGAALGARAQARPSAPLTSAVLADWGVIAPDDDVAVRAEATAGGLALVAEASVAGFPWAWLDEQLQDRFAEFPACSRASRSSPPTSRRGTSRRGAAGPCRADARAVAARGQLAAPRRRRPGRGAGGAARAGEGERPSPARAARRRRVARRRALSPRADNSPRRDAVVPDAAPAAARAAGEENAGARRARSALRRAPTTPRRARSCPASRPAAPRRRLAAPRRRAAERRRRQRREQGPRRRRGGPAPEPLPADYLAPGARVECRYMATSEFYGGVVASYVNGRYTVEYDDMGTEHGVDRLRLRLPGQAMAPPAVDAVVDAWHPGSNCVRRASVVGLGAERVTVKFDDDGVVHDVGRGSLFGAFLPPGLAAPLAPMRVGDAVECRYLDTAEFYSGKIVADDGDGAFAVHYDDGDDEARVPRRKLRYAGQAMADGLALGETVDAACAARDGAVLPGMVVEVYKGGNYKVNFDDADLDEVVLPRDAIFSGFYGDAAEPAADAEPSAPAAPAEPEPAAPTPIAFSGSAADMLKSMGAAVPEQQPQTSLEDARAAKQKLDADKVCTDEHCTEDHAHGHDHGDGEVCTEDHGHGGHDHGGDHASHDHASHDHASHDHDSHDHDHHEEEPAHAHDHHEEDSGHKHDEPAHAHDHHEEEPAHAHDHHEEDSGHKHEEPAHAHDHHKEEPAHAHDHHEEEHEHEEEPAHAHDDDAVHAHDDDDEPEPTVVRPAQPALAPGTRVMCRYGNDAEFYAGVVDGGGGGAYSVAYDDGDVETAVARRRLYVPGQVQAEALEVGETVDAVCDARDGDVLPATVASRFDDGTYEVAFDFGPGAVVPRSKIFGEFHDPERAASPRPKMATPVKALAARAPDVVEPVEGPDAPASPDVVEDRQVRDLAPGTAVDAVRKSADGRVVAAAVVAAGAGGCRVRFADDGAEETADRGDAGPAVGDRDAAPVGTVCDCREAEGGAYAPCTVTAVDAATGSHTVWHADARREEAGVSRRRLRLRGMVPPSRLDVGEEVDAWRSTTGSVVAGVIVYAHANGSYTVRFDDDDAEHIVEFAAIFAEGVFPELAASPRSSATARAPEPARTAAEAAEARGRASGRGARGRDAGEAAAASPRPAAAPRSLESHEHHLMASDADHPTSPHAGAFDDVDKQSHISSAAFSEHMEAQFDDAFDAFNDQEGFPPDSASSGGFDRGETAEPRAGATTTRATRGRRRRRIRRCGAARRWA